MFLSKLDSLNNALKLIDDNQKCMDTGEVPLNQAHKRVLAEDIIAYHNSPPFDMPAISVIKLLVKGKLL